MEAPGLPSVVELWTSILLLLLLLNHKDLISFCLNVPRHNLLLFHVTISFILHLFSRSFIHLFVHLFVRPFIYSFDDPSIRLLLKDI